VWQTPTRNRTQQFVILFLSIQKRNIFKNTKRKQKAVVSKKWTISMYGQAFRCLYIVITDGFTLFHTTNTVFDAKHNGFQTVFSIIL
jgi:hypothetical protein